MSDLSELQVQLGKNITLPYPIMVGGGVAKSIDPLKYYAATEVIAEWGSITTEPKSGNGGRDYYAHYEERYGQRFLAFALNSIGLTNPGMGYVEKFAGEVLARYQDCGKPLPINVSGESVEDTLVLMKRAIARGFPIITVNAACPNKAGKGARPMPVMCYDIDSMGELIVRADQEIGRTASVIMLKVSTGLPVPTLSSICVLIKASPTFDGIITGNTVPNGFHFLPDGEPAIKTNGGIEVGGLSGPAIKPLSLGQTKFAADFFGDKKMVWGCGGVRNAEDVRDYLRSGAKVVQTVTAFRESDEDPKFIQAILEDLID